MVWGIQTFMCFICAEDCELLEFVLELLLLKKDQLLNMPLEAAELEFDELEDDDHEDEPDLFEDEDELLRPWEAEFLFELILMPTEKTTQLALLAETQAHMEKFLKMLLKLLLLMMWVLMFNWFAKALYRLYKDVYNGRAILLSRQKTRVQLKAVNAAAGSILCFNNLTRFFRNYE